MGRIRTFLDGLEGGLAGLTLLVGLSVVVAEIGGRALFQHSFIWSEELSRYLLIWMTYLGASAVTREGKHIRVTFFLDLVAHRARKWIECATTGFCAVFTAVVFMVSIRYVEDSRNLGMMSADSDMIIPLWIFQAIIPVGFLLMTVRLFGRAYDLIRGPAERSPDPAG